MTESDMTLVDRILRRLKNNPLVAGIIVFGIIVSASGAFWDRLPRPWRDWLVDQRPGPEVAPRPNYPENGWVFAGYVDKDDPQQWSSEQRVVLTRRSAGRDRPDIIRAGDVVRPLRPIPQVIADYRARGAEHQLVSPVEIVEVIHKAEDFTGLIYTPDTELEVMDVSVSQLPGRDYAVWLRVAPKSN